MNIPKTIKSNCQSLKAKLLLVVLLILIPSAHYAAAWGVLPSDTFFASFLQGDGSGIGNLNAGNLSTGTLPDSRLSTNVYVDDGSENYYYRLLNTRFEPAKINYNNTGKKNTTFSDSIMVLSSYQISENQACNCTGTNAVHVVPYNYGGLVQGVLIPANVQLNATNANSGFVYLNMSNLSTNGRGRYYQRMARLYNGSVAWSNITLQYSSADNATRYMIRKLHPSKQGLKQGA